MVKYYRYRQDEAPLNAIVVLLCLALGAVILLIASIVK